GATGDGPVHPIAPISIAIDRIATPRTARGRLRLGALMVGSLLDERGTRVGRTSSHVVLRWSATDRSRHSELQCNRLEIIEAASLMESWPSSKPRRRRPTRGGRDAGLWSSLSSTSAGLPKRTVRT